MKLNELKYEDYLKTEYWKNLSESIKKEADYRCQICNSEDDLNVHHRSYKYKGFLELEKKDLICICEKCHSIYHVNQIYDGQILKSCSKFFESLEKGFLNTNKIKIGFKELDVLLNINEGSVVLLSGETLIYNDFIYNIYLKNMEESIFFSLRLSTKNMMAKILSIETGVSSLNLYSNILDSNEWGKLGIASQKISSSSSKIFTEIYELKDIEAVISKYCLEKKLYYIDSLNYLIKSNWSNVEIESLIRQIKKIAKKYNVCIILNYDFPTSLINKVRNRADRRPLQSDLDSICNFLTYVDEILMFYREDYYDSDSENYGITEVIISKLNQTILLKYFQSVSKFGDYKKCIL